MVPVVLIDTSNLAYRSHYAFSNLSDEQGRPTGICYGFLRAVLSLRKLLGHRLVFCFDQGVPTNRTEKAIPMPQVQPGGAAARTPQPPAESATTGRKSGKAATFLPHVTPWRRVLTPSYQENRHSSCSSSQLAAQDAVSHQLPVVSDLLADLGYLRVGVPGLEADDVIGMLCGQTATQSICIYSGDKDFFQLLALPTVEILRPRAGKPALRIDRKVMLKEFGVEPKRWAEYLAISGDSVDCVKAVQGWGPKKALKLLAAGIDLREPFSRQPGDLQPTLAPHWENLLQAYELTRIPVSYRDSRIASYCRTTLFPALDQYHGPTPVPDVYQNFMTFCAVRDLKEFIANKDEFFRGKTDAEEKPKGRYNPG